MARPQRIKKDSDSHYHLMSRTNNKRFLFREGALKTELVSALRRAAEFCGIHIKAYTAMDNHFHVVVKVIKPDVPVCATELLRRVRVLKGERAMRSLSEHWDDLSSSGFQATLKGEQERLRARMHDISEFIKLFKEEVTQERAVTMTEYTTKGFRYRLYCFTNVRSLLEENEMEAWQKLVRVLTHEMMNSIAPIISLSETLAERVEQDNRGEQLDEMIVHGMKVIHRRSKGLLEFVENYRKLSRLSSPVLAYVKVGDLLSDIKKLFHNPKIDYRYDIEEKEQLLFIDRSQIEQVLINLLKNAEEACAEQPNPVVKITTSYLKEKHLLLISVSDNGCGILPDVQEKIFVPFFTTKQKGSGIGLSLCKQIMSLHGGSISVKSEEGVGSTFTLKFVCR